MEEHILFETVTPMFSVRKRCLYAAAVITSVQTELLFCGHIVGKLTTAMSPGDSEELSTFDLRCKCRAVADAMERELVERLAASLKAGINLIPPIALEVM